MKCVLVVGNIADGIHIVGPFDTVQEAEEYAGPKLDEWIVMWLSEPEPETE